MISEDCESLELFAKRSQQFSMANKMMLMKIEKNISKIFESFLLYVSDSSK